MPGRLQLEQSGQRARTKGASVCIQGRTEDPPARGPGQEGPTQRASPSFQYSLLRVPFYRH